MLVSKWDKKMQGYYKKAVEDIGEEMVVITWERMDWHKLFKGGAPEECDDDNKDSDDNEGSRDDERRKQQ